MPTYEFETPPELKIRCRRRKGSVIPLGGRGAALMAVPDVAVKFRLSFQIPAEPEGRGHLPGGEHAWSRGRSCRRNFLIAF